MKPRKPFLALVGEYTALAFLLPTATFVGWAIGKWLDKVFGTSFLYLVFLLLGIASGLLQVIRQVLRDSGDNGS